MTRRTNGHRLLVAVAASVFAAACGTAGASETAEPDGTPDAAADEAPDAAPGVRLVDVEEASEMLAAGDRVVIDVRTPDEFASGHLAGARMIDIQGPTFADEIGALDPDASYLVYCRTANRSAGARQLMTELGFRDVADIAGGVVAWSEAGLPLEP